MAETALLKSIEAHNFGDAFYFWIRMDKDPRNPLKQDFWAFCDAINAGNCRCDLSNPQPCALKIIVVSFDNDFIIEGLDFLMLSRRCMALSMIGFLFPPCLWMETHGL